MVLIGTSRYGKTTFARSLGKHIYLKGTGGSNWKCKRDELLADNWDYLVIDDWPMAALGKNDFYKGVMDGNGEATFTSKWFEFTIPMRNRPVIFLFNPMAYDSLLNGALIDPDYWNINTSIVRLNSKLYQ